MSNIDRLLDTYRKHMLELEREGGWCFYDETEQERGDRIWALYARVLLSGVTLMETLDLLDKMVTQHCTKYDSAGCRSFDYGISVNRDAINMMERVGWYEQD